MEFKKLAAAVALMLGVMVPGAAQKKGFFDANALRPERVKEVKAGDDTQASGKKRVEIVDGVRPVNMVTTRRITDVTAAPMAPNMHGKAGVPQLRALGDGTTLYGSMIYSNAWSGTTGSYGIYSFPASEWEKPTMVYNQGAYEANGGGCYLNGMYYWNTFVYTDEMGYTFTTFCSYNFATGELKKNIMSFLTDGFDLQQITNAMAADPTTGKLYALASILVPDEEGIIARYYPAISEVDDYTGFVTPIAQIPTMVALACSPGGQLYAISKGTNAGLYTINKTTGDCILVGPTGVSTDFTQSMAFDPVTGKLYWAAVRSNGTTALYEVDPATGAASQIFNFGDNEEYAGLYIPAPDVAAEAPGLVTVEALYNGGSQNGVMTVTAPTKNYAGNTLTGTMEVKMLIDGVERQSVSLSAGGKAEFRAELTEGVHNFTAYATNGAGEGPRATTAKYVGVDAPSQVRNLKLEAMTNGDAHLTWEAPLTGRHDGYVDASQLTYTVTRYPSGEVVARGLKATEFTDNVDINADNFYYEVKGYCGDREGTAAYTESMLLGRGDGLPVKYGFATREEFDLFTVIDANGDWDKEYKWGGWMYGPEFSFIREEDGNCAMYGYSPDNAADDWLITPPFEAEAGKKYRVTFTMWTRGDQERLEVTAGGQNTVAAQKTIMAPAIYTNKTHDVMSQDFTAETSGNYYVGFHMMSAKKKYYLYITDIIIDVVPDEDAPAAPGDLTVTPAAQGGTSATLTFTAPNKTMGGATLSKLDKIEIFHGMDKDPCGVIQNPAPGSRQTWVDDPIDGHVDYRVIAYSNGKAGAKAEASSYVGWDIPEEVTGVTVSDASGAPVINWTAPTTGINGGYVDASQLTYTIYRYEDTLEMIGRNVKGTTFTDTELNGHTIQHLVAYLVQAQSPAGYGDPGVTDYIVFGDPYTGEFQETFEDTSVHSTPWVMYKVKGTNQNWGVTSYGTNPYCSPAENDGGMAVYSADGWMGDEGRLVSPKLNLSSMPRPTFSFYFFHNYTDEHEAWGEAFQDRLIPEVQKADGTFEALGEAIYVDDLGTGWLKYSYPLDKYRDEEYVCLSLHGVCGSEQDVYVDHLTVVNDIEKDLQVYTFTGSRQIEAGNPATYRLTVYNRGSKDAEAGSYNVVLNHNGRAIETRPGMAIKSKEYQTYEFNVNFSVDAVGSEQLVDARIDFDGDEVPGNNMSESVMTLITSPALAEVHELKGSVEGESVTLHWDAPTALRVDDSFENYTPFEIDNFGHYTMVDGDGNYTWGFSNVYFDHTGEAQAFMVFDPVSLGVVDPASSLFPYDAFDPHSGRQVLACFQGVAVGSDGYGESAPNDDWFISGEVYDGQTISFWAKSGDYLQGIDKFEVLYSTTDRSTSSFKKLSGVIDTSDKWTEHTFQLPANTKYFAIHCVSEDGFVLYIDDLKYMERFTTTLVKHTGYRVYRDGKVIAELPANVESFTDAGLKRGDYEYYVTAVYDNASESGASNVVELRIGEGGINGVANDESGVKVTSDRGVIVVSGATADATVAVVAADGKVLFEACGEETYRVNVATGVYMVRVADRNFKVAVK